MSGIELSDYVYVNAGPVVQSSGVKGSYRTVADLTARNAIGNAWREAGMWVYVEADLTIYQLGNDLTTWSVVPFGSGAGSAIATASVASASALDDTAYVNGTLITINTFDELWVYNKNDTTTPTNGVTCIASFTGKRYYRVGVPSQKWTRVDNWYIDNIAGNDENVGSIGAPLKTRAELSRRLKRNAPAQNTTVHYIGDYNVKDVIDTVVAPGTIYTEQGQATTVLTGTFTTVVAASGYDQDAFTDSAVTDWTPHYGRRITVTSGANAGAFTFIGYDLQSGAIQVAPWKIANANGTVVSARKPPSTGDSYKVETLSKCACTIIATDGDQSTIGNIQFRDLLFDNTSFLLTVNGSGAVPVFVGCSFAVVVFVQSKIQTTQCHWLYGMVSYNGSQWECYGGMLHGFYGWFGQLNSAAYFYDGPFFTNSSGVYLQLGTVIEMNGAQFYKTTAGFLGGAGSHGTLDPGSVIYMAERWTGTNRVYGDVATRRAFTLRGASKILYKTAANQTIRGSLSGGEIEAGTNDEMRAWDEGAGAYTAAIQCTFANLATTLLNNAHNLALDAHVIQAG